MNEFAECSLANDFWSRISCGDYVELYLIVIILLFILLNY